MWPGRRLPPAHSPVAARALGRAWLALAGGPDPSRRLVDALRRRFGAAEVVLTDSGTSALVLALRMVGGPKATVALPAYSCVDLVAAAVAAGCRIRLYDVDPGSLAPDPASVQAALRRGADALLVAPLFGYPFDLPALRDLAHGAGAVFIEDAAQGAAGRWHGDLLGSFGDLTVLSFGRGKGLNGGGGGALLLRGPGLDRARPEALPWGGRGVGQVLGASLQWAFSRPRVYALPAGLPFLHLGETRYHPAGEPIGASCATAVLVTDSLERVDEEAEARRRVAHALEARLASGGGAVIAPPPGSDPGYLRLALLSPFNPARPVPQLGVLRSYPLTLDQEPHARAVVLPGEAGGPGARLLADRLLTAPTHQYVTDADVQAIAGALQGVIPAG